MMKIKFVFITILFLNLLSAQSNRSDTLKKYSYSDLEEKYYTFNANDNTVKANVISHYYLRKAQREKNSEKIIEGYILEHFNAPFSAALKYLDSVQNLTVNSHKDVYPARTYLLKGNLFFRNDQQKKALNNYILGLKSAKEKGNKRQIAFAETSIAYLNNYIGKHHDAAKTLRHYLYNAPYLSESELAYIHLNLASTYLDINKMDSANVLIREGLTSSEGQNIYRYNQYLSLSGRYNLKQKKYSAAIDNLYKSKKYFIDSESDDLNINYTTLYLGQAYAGLGKKQKAIQNFTSIDSLVKSTNTTFPELREVYSYLIDYYEENNNKEKQLYYIDRFLKVDSQLDSQFRYVSRELPRRYDTPNFIIEKAIITNELENKKIVFYISTGLLVSLLILLGYLFYRSRKSDLKHRKIAHDLLQSIYQKNEEQKITVTEAFMPEINTEEKTNRVTSEEIAQNILKELKIYETKEMFIQKGTTLNSVAKKAKTNTRYLSEVINIYKGKNFATYLNDLRIEYAINKLATDKKFRAYKIPFIAEELGYNNEQAFVLAFKKKTGTTLSVYLREIEKAILSKEEQLIN